ncbi:SMI1/KNR4 family protein [Pseudomonas monteilii]|jgi:hypothetical protein
MSYLDTLAFEIQASGEEPAYSGGAADGMIAQFEEALGVAFPDAYKHFLKTYGALSFAGDTYYGITGSGLTAREVPCVAFATQTARSEGDADSSMIVIMASGYGPIYSIDTSIIGGTGEPVIIETPLSFKRTGEKIIIYQSFEAFFTDMIRSAIREL